MKCSLKDIFRMYLIAELTRRCHNSVAAVHEAEEPPVFGLSVIV